MAAAQNKATIKTGQWRRQAKNGYLTHPKTPITHRFNDLVYLLLSDSDIFPQNVVYSKDGWRL